jgi:hypothetical protein
VSDNKHDWQRKIALETFNACWDLIDKGASRTLEENQRMEHLSHTSRCLWEQAGGTPAHLARGDWQIAWVYAQLGSGANALRFAERCLRRCEEGSEADGFKPFDLPAAYQAMIAASVVLGDTEARDRHVAKARAAAAAIPDEESRSLILQQIQQALELRALS